MSDDEGTYFSEDDDDYDDFDELQSYSSLAQSFYEGFQAATNLLRNRFRPGASRSAWDRPHYNDDDALYGLQEGGFNGPVPKFRARPHVIEDGEDDEEDHLAVVETYSPYYMPRKLKIGLKHPDPVVEAASLASVDPTDTWYDLSLPSQIVNSGKLSALQLESITYACQQHEQMLKNGDRAGFLLGDGAGVGKGRTIAGLIFENYLKGRTRSIWVSVSNDLKYDAERDLKDIGADEFIKVNILSKLSYNRIASGVNGFITSGVIFSTYSALIGHTTQTNAKFKTRLEQLLEWCGPDFEGVIVFDESHRAKNLCPENSRKPTKTGLTVQELQDRLPRARIVYASATGASEPRNMAYMTRLGIWGETSSFLDFKTFLSAVSKRGVSAMELVSMDLKLRGTYISRQLSFDGVTFKIEEVPLSPEFIAVYDESAKLWVKIKTVFEELAELLELDKDGLKKMWSQFWGAHQRFFKTLCISAKVSRAVAVARAAVSAGKCAVIGLQSTGEARMRGFLEKNNGELDEFVSSAKGVLENFVTKHFPSVDASQGKKRPATSQTRGNGVKRRGATRVNVPATCQPPAVSDATKIRKVETTKKEIMADIEALGARLPHNTLDQLIDELGGTGKVAEMTGRKGRVVRSCENGPISYELREAGDTPLDALNMTEKQYFMDGDKLIAIISEAASSGISLQSDRRVPNQRRRVHITLELPWSADRAVQQFGRTHRCNQVNAPEYVFLISALAGEKRFASIVAKRLETLGALTQGDRRATEKRDFTQFNFDNKYGRLALDSIMKSMFQTASPEAPTPAGFLDKASEALEGVGLIVVDKESKTKILHKDCNSVRRFLNRILGLPVELQNQMFDFFTDTLNVIINRAKKNGTFDLGIMDLGMGSEKVSRISVDRYVRKQATGVAVTELHALHGERGMSWTQAIDLYSDLIGKNEGFYLAREETFGKTTVLLAESYPDDKETLFTVHHPNTGAQPKKMTLTQLEKDYRAVTEADAESHWTKKYEASDTQCNHAYLRGRCRSVIAGFDCDIGLRKKKYFVLSGAVLCVWPRVEAILSEDRQTTKMRVIRLCTVDGARIIGAMIPKTCVDSLKEALSTDAEEVKREEFSSS